MMFKTGFLLLACCTFVLSFNIDSRIRRQATQADSRNTRTNEGDTTNSQSSGLRSGTSGSNGLSNSLGSERGSASDTQSALGGSGNSGLSNTFGGSNGASRSQDAMRGFGQRLQNAFNRTYQEERDSVSDSWNNVKNLIHQDVETKANLTKTGFDLGTVVPKFGKNFIIYN